MKQIFLFFVVSLSFIDTMAQSGNNHGTFKIVKNHDSVPIVSCDTWKSEKPAVKYPDSARQNGIQGTVYVSFIVEVDGTISNIRIVKGVAPILDNESIRAVKALGHITPETQDGKPVRLQFTLPFRFELR